MDARIPVQIQPIIETYSAQIDRNLSELVSSFYIVGSIALNGFNPYFSDIDFITLLQRPANMEEIAKLGEIHQTIEAEHPKWKFSGIYLQSKDVGKSENEIAPQPYYHDGKMHARGTFEINSVTWWVLKNYGIIIKGVAPAQLDFEVDWDFLISSMWENLNSYWLSWTKQIKRYPVLLTDWGIQWTVLGVLRQYYTFQENSITTKEKAGEYALEYLPSRWKALILDALCIRTGQEERFYRSRIKRAIIDRSFLKEVIRICNGLFE